MHKLVDFFLNIYLFPFFKIAKNNHQEGMLDYICKGVEDSVIYPSFRIRLKETRNEPKMFGMCSGNKCAIVLQGPINTLDNMTLESVRYYKAQYENICVIVSTWEDEREELLCELENEGAVIVKSKKPKKPGTLNINYQLVSSMAGVLKAKELECEYVAKTRTDQRIRKAYVFDSLIHLVNLFPVDNTEKLRKRIVVLPTFFGNMFTPYFISDFFYFGATEDLMLLFDIEKDDRGSIEKKDLVSRKDYSKSMYPPEIYLVKTFLSTKLDYDCQDSISSYWEALKRFFICIDPSMIDLFSEKYEYSHREHVNQGQFLTNDSIKNKLSMKFGFFEWLSLVSGTLLYKEEYEKECDVDFATSTSDK